MKLKKIKKTEVYFFKDEDLMRKTDSKARKYLRKLSCSLCCWKLIHISVVPTEELHSCLVNGI